MTPVSNVLTIRSSWRVVLRLTLYYFAIAGFLVGAAAIGGRSDEGILETAVILTVVEIVVLLICAIAALAVSASYIMYHCRSLVVLIDGSTVIAKSRRGRKRFKLASDQILIALPPRWPEFYRKGDPPEFAQVYIISFDHRGDKSVVHLGQVVLYGALYRRWLRENGSALRVLGLKVSNHGFEEFPKWHPGFGYGNARPNIFRSAWKDFAELLVRALSIFK